MYAPKFSTKGNLKETGVKVVCHQNDLCGDTVLIALEHLQNTWVFVVIKVAYLRLSKEEKHKNRESHLSYSDEFLGCIILPRKLCYRFSRFFVLVEEMYIKILQ